MNTTIKLRRDTQSNWSNVNPILAEAELGVELDTSKVKLGDGITPWNDLDYLIGKEEEIPIEDRPELIWEWEVTADQSNTLELPLDGLYTCTIDWGDGSALESVTDVTKPNHIYTEPGRYTVILDGTLDEVGWYNNIFYYNKITFGEYPSGYQGKLRRVLSWGDYMRDLFYNLVPDHSTHYGFNGNPYIEYIAPFSIKNYTNTVSFSFCPNLKEAPLLLDRENKYLPYFRNCTQLKDISNLEGWGNVNSLGWHFKDCTSLTDISPLSTWNISNVTSINGLFEGCTNLKDLTPLKDWDTSSVTSFNNVFKDCHSLTTLKDLENWVISGSSDVPIYFGSRPENGLFENCHSLQDISALANWNFDNTVINAMFKGCSSLKDISPLDWANLSSIAQIVVYETFKDCYSLSSIPSTFIISRVAGSPLSESFYYHELFKNCYSLRLLDFSSTLHTQGYKSSTFTNCNFSKDSLIELFNYLEDVTTESGTYELGIQNNPGVGHLTSTDIQIATNKGWTVLT